MTNLQEKKRVIQELDEKTFREELIIPLLRKMPNHLNVRERHGTAEYGKDITYSVDTGSIRSNVAIVAKVGDITGAASGKQNLAVVQNQISMAFNMPFNDLESKKKETINSVIVWCNGRISQNAQEQIISNLDNRFNNVEFFALDKTLELLDKYYQAFFTIRDPYVSDYFNSIKQEYEKLEDLRTLGGLSEKFQLPKIFVPPTILKLEKSAPGKSKLKEKRRNYSINQILNEKRNIAIVGVAGSGKSTLLRRILLLIIEDNEIKLKRTPIPIFVEFKSLKFDAADPIREALLKEFRRFTVDIDVESVFNNDLEDGNIVVLIDGLDELRDEILITNALQHLNAFSEKYKGSRIIITSRMLDAFKNPEDRFLSTFLVLNLMNLNQDQMRSFVDNWFGVESKVGRKMLEIVQGAESLHGLPATPFTLALVAILFESGTKEIPANLTELYKKYIELVLGRWDTTKDITLQFEYGIKDFLLRKIAWKMQSDYALSISEAEFRDGIERLGRERGFQIDPMRFQDEILTRSELMIHNLDGKLEFKHNTFQDFFAGSEISGLPNATELITKNFLDSWWSEAIFFACGLRHESEDFIKAIINDIALEQKDYLSYAVNLGMLTQATYLAPIELKQEAIKRSIQLLIESWDLSCAKFGEALNSPNAPKEGSFQLLLASVYMGLGKQMLGSITLSEALKNITTEFIQEVKTKTSSNLRDAAEAEWRCLLLAIGNAECENIDQFIALAELPIMRTPLYWVGVGFYSDELMGRSWLSSADKARLKTLGTRLDKKLKGQKKYFEDLKNKPPILLPARTSNVD